MCGIAGILARSSTAAVDRAVIERMCATLVHRGPDAEGVAVHGTVALGMRRLSIIDVEGGAQPLYNEDRTVVVVFNGEIYNHLELRRDLEARGHELRSRSDGEVIAHLWEEHGADFASRLSGMFAIALYDIERGVACFVRDRLGVKPLYYAQTPTHIVFASEVKAILASRLIPRELDASALAEFISWEYVPAPRTLIRAVRKLEPGHLLEVDVRQLRATTRCWWDIPSEAPSEAGGSRPQTVSEWREAVDCKLRLAVERRLMSDVPLGAFLSGGVDSSLVVSAMHAAGAFKTFSIGFDDPSYDETAWSKRVAEHLDVDHRVEILRPRSVELFDRLMNHLDDPIGDFSIFPTFLVSQVARRDVTVALSGDGGDEIFGGYETYVAQARARAWARIPGFLRRRAIEPLIRSLRPGARKKGVVNKAKRFLEGLEHSPALAHARWRLFVSEGLRRELFTPQARSAQSDLADSHILALFRRCGARTPLSQGLYVDVKSYLSDNCLVKVDRMSMACSLEVRVPFCDHELVELAFAMPDALKVRGGRTKVLLKELAARRVPRSCVYRPKEGFSIPIKHWLRKELRALLEDLLAAERIRGEGLFQVHTVERLKREHFDGRANHSHILWALMVFQDWRRRWAV